MTNAAAHDAARPFERCSALALQTVCDAVNQDKTRNAARARMREAVSRVAAQIAAPKGFLKSFNGYDLKLVTRPLARESEPALNSRSREFSSICGATDVILMAPPLVLRP